MSQFLFVAAQTKALTGGSELLWSQVALRLAKMGHSVTVSLPTGGRFSGGEDVPTSFSVTYRERSANGLIQRLQRKLGKQTRGAEETLLRALRPDVVVINQPGYTEGVTWASITRRLGLPYILIVHNIHRWTWLHPDYAAEVGKVYADAARVDLLSDQAERDLEDILGLNLRNIARFRNPYNVSFAEAPPFPAAEAGYSLAMVGRLDVGQKGYDLALRALADPRWRERNVTLNLYGDGEYKEFILRMAGRLGLPRVVAHGHVSDIGTIWRDNHALLMPSRYEGLPIAMVEAMLSARPVIATDVGGVSEWIRHGENGFLIPAATPSLVAQALEEAWAKRDHWKAMGGTAREDALRLTSADPVGDYAEGLLSMDFKQAE